MRLRLEIIIITLHHISYDTDIKVLGDMDIGFGISRWLPGFWWRHKAWNKGGPKLASKPMLPIGGLALGGAFMV